MTGEARFCPVRGTRRAGFFRSARTAASITTSFCRRRPDGRLSRRRRRRRGRRSLDRLTSGCSTCRRTGPYGSTCGCRTGRRGRQPPCRLRAGSPDEGRSHGGDGGSRRGRRAGRRQAASSPARPPTLARPSPATTEAAPPAAPAGPRPAATAPTAVTTATAATAAPAAPAAPARPAIWPPPSPPGRRSRTSDRGPGFHIRSDRRGDRAGGSGRQRSDGGPTGRTVGPHSRRKHSRRPGHRAGPPRASRSCPLAPPRPHPHPDRDRGPGRPARVQCHREHGALELDLDLVPGDLAAERGRLPAGG